MKKFTVIAEYKGGTYVSQHYADTVDEAVMKWAENLDLQYFSEKEKRKIAKPQLSDEQLELFENIIIDAMHNETALILYIYQLLKHQHQNHLLDKLKT